MTSIEKLNVAALLYSCERLLHNLNAATRDSTDEPDMKMSDVPAVKECRKMIKGEAS
jgi:hypothetical protein